MSSQTLQLIVFVGLAFLAALAYWRTKGKVTPQQLAQAAQMAVMAAEQYKTTGELKTNDEQLRFAIGFVKDLLPAANAIPDALIIDVIHAFVPAANAITAQIEAAWSGIDATKPPAPPASPTLGNMG